MIRNLRTSGVILSLVIIPPSRVILARTHNEGGVQVDVLQMYHVDKADH